MAIRSITHTNGISVVIPAYDAGATVADVVSRSLQQMDRVLVIDDGSSDTTADEAAGAGARVARHQENRGKGAALLTGMRQLIEEGATGVITLDADGQHLPEEIPKLLAMVAKSQQEGAPVDIVLGSRAHLFEGMSRARQSANRISSGLISFAAGKPFDDVQTGFRYYSRRVIQEFGMPGTGFEAESAVIVLAARGGYSVVTTPIELGFTDGRGTSHYRSIYDSIRIAKAVISARYGPLSWAHKKSS
ncbi:MAG TPA: glycosyltransferase family 2 protein [Planctomycetes bacterium]|nr:glycosyltransferase family 2 protein [Planctomycetota bacterium]HIL36407.1 glycosyltransferase family 2 protein [Planctomycetota bacterium]